MTPESDQDHDASGDSDASADYAFGDSGAAADRLELLAEVFAEPSRSLVREVVGHPVNLVVDLGCGPGYSTRLLALEVRHAALVGLDLSEAFLDRARTVVPTAAWYRHDVTITPFPTVAADLIYARLVLAHLSNPELVLRSWLPQLRRDGLLLIEEDEAITADHPVLSAYEAMAASLVARHGGDLYVGRRLAKIVDLLPGYRRELSRSCRHEVAVPLAARLFSENFRTWRHDPHVVARYPIAQLDAMSAELDRLAASDESGGVTFVIRQLAFRRLNTGTTRPAL